MTRLSTRLNRLIAKNNIKKCFVVIKKHEETQQKCREFVCLKGVKAPKRIGVRRATVTQDRDIILHKALIDSLKQDPGNDFDEAALTPRPARVLARRATAGDERDVSCYLVSDESSRMPLRVLNSPGQSETVPKPERQMQPIDLTIGNRENVPRPVPKLFRVATRPTDPRQLPACLRPLPAANVGLSLFNRLTPNVASPSRMINYVEIERANFAVTNLRSLDDFSANRGSFSPNYDEAPNWAENPMGFIAFHQRINEARQRRSKGDEF